MSAHKHAALMLQYAQDAAETETPWERWEVKVSHWIPADHHPGWAEKHEYRRKPRTININGFEVPEPMREKPEKGTLYFFADPSAANLGDSDGTWCGDMLDNAWLSRGLCHLTREAAELHAKALLSFTQSKQGGSEQHPMHGAL